MLTGDMNLSSATIVAKLLFENQIVAINTTDLFQFVSGILSPIYIDNRQLISIPEARNTIVDLFVDTVQDEIGADRNCVVAGVATGGIPWSAWIAFNLHLPMVYVRSTAKDRGKRRQVEGVIYPNQRVILVEDTVSTGTSITNAAEAIREAGGRITKCMSIFTFGALTATERFLRHDLAFSALTNLSSLLIIGENLGHIDTMQVERIQSWAEKSFQDQDST